MPSNFYLDVIQKDNRFRLASKINDLALLEPITRAAVNSIIAAAFSRFSIIIAVTETYRSLERQKALFAAHATEREDVGVHHYGLAADFVKLVHGGVTWKGDWTFLRTLAEEHGMISGLDWGEPNIKHSLIDADHVQRCKKQEQAALFAGLWYPAAA